jgi:hypothetical protein
MSTSNTNTGGLDALELSRVMGRAADALGHPLHVIELMDPLRARQMSRDRARELEGIHELLGRDEDSLAAFLALLDRIPTAGTIANAIEAAAKR